MHFFYGLLGIILSFFIVKYREDIVEMIGKISWAEKYLGSTYNAIFLIGVFVFIISFLFFIGEEKILFGGFGKYF